MIKRWIPITFLCVLLLTIVNGSVTADVAPPLQPPGASPGLLEFAETNVSMDWESVVFRVGDSDYLYYASDAFPAVNATVSASFIMTNYGDETETLEVVFPLTHLEGMGDGRFNFPEIQDFRVRVDDVPTVWETVETPNPYDETEPPLKWAQFLATFPPEQPVFIDIDYDVQSTGYFPTAVFSYVLETGAGWSGPIRDAYLTLILPYEASEENVLVGQDLYPYTGGAGNPQPEWNGNQVTWNWKDLEPTREDNWGAAIWAPHIWQEVIDLREQMETKVPGAAAKLTRWYDALIIDRGIRAGAEGLVELNLQAYQRALLDDPWNADASARYANFLLFLYGFGRESDRYEGMLDDVHYYASYAQEIDPFNATALDVLKQLENSYDYVPPPEESAQGGGLAAETETDEPAAQPCDPAPAEQNYTLIYLLGGALVLALLVIIVLIYHLGWKKEA